MVKNFTNEITNIRIDVNSMAKYFKDELKTLKNSVKNIETDIDEMEDEFGEFAKEIDKNSKATENNKNNSEADYFSKLISDDFTEREARLLESIEQLLAKRLNSQNVKPKRKKILGIF